MKRAHQPKVYLLLIVTIGLASAGGCGTETYNKRVEQSAKLFAYVNLLNENLGTLWNNSGVEIRMPRQLTEIPPPAVELDENGTMTQSGPDERQPDFFSATDADEILPGLIGAWTGKVEAEVAGEIKQADAYAYVMSNAYLWAKGEQEEATVFKDTVAAAVMNGLNLPLFEAEDWKLQTYPPTPGFIPQQSANVWVTKTDRLVGETRAELSLHLFKVRDIQVAVLFIYPETIESTEHISKRIDLALETIKISPELPTGLPATAKPPAGSF